MNELKVVGRLLAHERGEAVRITRERSFPLCDEPLVFVPIVMAGASPFLWALGIGNGLGPCHVSVCTEPRSRIQQYELLGRAATDMDGFLQAWDAEKDLIPQVITASCDASRICLVTIHRMTFAAQPALRAVGRRLHWLDRAYEQPDSGALLDMPSAICQLFATGQDEHADSHLGAVLEWLKPADGVIYERVVGTEQNLVSTSTHPRLDNEKLLPLMQALRQAERMGTADSITRIRLQIEHIFEDEVCRRYGLIVEALRVCRSFPPSATAHHLRQQDRARYERNLAYVSNPDNLVSARLSGSGATTEFLSRELRAEYLQSMAIRSVSSSRAAARLSGDILVGQVIGRAIQRAGRRTLVHYKIRSSQDRLRIRPGDKLLCLENTGCCFCVIDLGMGDSGDTIVSLELTEGKTNPRQPLVGDQVELAEPMNSPGRIARTMRLARARLRADRPQNSAPSGVPLPRDYLSEVKKLRSSA